MFRFELKKIKSIMPHVLLHESGNFNYIDGLQELKAMNDILEYFIFKNKGAQIDDSINSGNRVGAFIVEADNITELHKKIKKGYMNIEVYDITGNAMLNRKVINIE